MDNNNRKNQDYIDLRDGFAQSYPPQHVPPAHVPPPKAKFPFAPKNSNTFVLILILANIFLQFMLGIAIGIMMILDPGFSPADFFPAWGQILYIQILVLGVPSAIYLIIKRKHIKEILPFRRLGWRNVLMIIGLSLLMQPVLMLINSVGQLVFPNVISDVMLDMLAEGGILLSLAVFAMIPPITEEIAFRGIGFAGFRHVKIGTAAIINGLVFGFLHMNMNQFIYTFIGGVIFCYMMYYTKSIWAPILSHFVINAGQVLLMFWAAGAATPDAMAQAELYLLQGGMETVIVYVVLGIIGFVAAGLFIAIYIAFKRHNLRRNEAEGIITDTAAAAREAGLPRPRAFTWAFWVTVAAFAMMMIIFYLILPMMPAGVL